MTNKANPILPLEDAVDIPEPETAADEPANSLVREHRSESEIDDDDDVDFVWKVVDSDDDRDVEAEDEAQAELELQSGITDVAGDPDTENGEAHPESRAGAGDEAEDDEDIDLSPHDAVFASARSLGPGDHVGARQVLAEAALADLDPLAVGGLIREIKAKTGISAGDIRKAYAKIAGSQKASSGAKARGLPFAVYQPSPAPTQLWQLLDEIADLFRKYISCSEHDITIATLWCAGTYGVRAGVLPGEEAGAEIGPDLYPRLRVNSGGPGSGKSTFLDLMGFVAARALTADGITASSMFRTVEAYQPTLILDEVDAWVNGNESVRQTINSGHRRTGLVILSVKDSDGDDADWEPKSFRTFAPAVLSGLGSLAPTIEDRSIAITMTKTSAFRGKNFKRRDLVKFRDAIAPQLVAHGDDMAIAMSDWGGCNWPAGLSSRAVDNWDPLLAVAYLAGPWWLSRAYDACSSVAVDPKKARALSKPEYLLSDLFAYRRALAHARLDQRRARRAANTKQGGHATDTASVPGDDAPRGILSTSGFIEWLVNTPGYASPWAEGAHRDTRGRVLGGPTPHAIARTLRGFKIHPTRRDTWSKTTRRNEVVRGYAVNDLRSVWKANGSEKSDC